MSSNKEFVSEFIDVIGNKRQFDRVEEFLHKDFINHSIGQETKVGLEEGFHNSFKQFLIAVPTATFHIEKNIAEGDFVWTYATVKGLPGNTSMVSADILRFSEGKIIEKWDVHQPIPFTED